MRFSDGTGGGLRHDHPKIHGSAELKSLFSESDIILAAFSRGPRGSALAVANGVHWDLVLEGALAEQIQDNEAREPR